MKRMDATRARGMKTAAAFRDDIHRLARDARSSVDRFRRAMKIVNLADGVLTNLETLDLLRERTGEHGSAPTYPQPHDPFPTEMRCYDALSRTCAGGQVRENVRAFIEHIEAIELTPAEVLQLINLKPRERVVVHAVVASCERRLSEDEVDDLIHLCDQFL